MLAKILPDTLLFGKRITHRHFTRTLVQLIRDFDTIGNVETPGTGRDNRKSRTRKRAGCLADTRPLPDLAWRNRGFT
jgi:hypothetical protein